MKSPSGKGAININVLWEMGGAQRVLHGVLERTKGLVTGVTCGAGMPYKLSEIAASYGVNYLPIISSARAFSALWKRAYSQGRRMACGGGLRGPVAGRRPQRPVATPRTRASRRIPIRASRRCARRCARAASPTACRSSWPAASGVSTSGSTGSTIPSSARSSSSSARGRC